MDSFWDAGVGAGDVAVASAPQAITTIKINAAINANTLGNLNWGNFTIAYPPNMSVTTSREFFDYLKTRLNLKIKKPDQKARHN